MLNLNILFKYWILEILGKIDIYVQLNNWINKFKTYITRTQNNTVNLTPHLTLNSSKPINITIWKLL